MSARTSWLTAGLRSCRVAKPSSLLSTKGWSPIRSSVPSRSRLVRARYSSPVARLRSMCRIREWGSAATSFTPARRTYLLCPLTCAVLTSQVRPTASTPTYNKRLRGRPLWRSRRTGRLCMDLAIRQRGRVLSGWTAGKVISRRTLSREGRVFRGYRPTANASFSPGLTEATTTCGSTM